jgi:hypothetical protein
VPDKANMLMDTEETGEKSAHKSNEITEASAAVTPSVNVNKREQAKAKKYRKKVMNLTDTLEEGKSARKSNDITATPMRMTVTPNKKLQQEWEQDTLKKLQMAMKKGLEVIFGKGKRAPVPSMKRNPISAIVQRRTERGNSPQGTGGNGNGSFRTKPDGHGVRQQQKVNTKHDEGQQVLPECKQQQRPE